MARNRGHNEGTIYQRPNGRWCAQVSLSGRRLTHYAKTQRECREWLKETVAQVDSGLTIEGARTTLEAYLGKWMEVSRSRFRPKTVYLYEHSIRKHIIPYVGSVRLKDLRPDHIQSLYSAAMRDGRSVRIVHVMHAILHRALGQAVRWGLIGRNPADGVEKPALRTEEMKVLEPGQVAKLLEAARARNQEALYYLAVTTGMREGEILGLRWSDLDLETGELRVQRQFQYVPGQGSSLTELKSAASRRSIVLGADALEKLREHREIQGTQRLFAGDRWEENDLVFTNSFGRPIFPSNLIPTFKRLLEEADLPDMRFHDLRHTAATLMLKQGVHPKVVQERLGHSNISLTLGTYSHVIPGMQEDAAAKLDAMLRALRP